MKKLLHLTVGILVWLCLVVGYSNGAQTNISAANTSKYLGGKQWEWTIFIKAAPSVLNRIKCVEYKLHPTFTNPVQQVCRRGTDSQAFPLTATGWGTFEVAIRVIFNDGGVRTLAHNLTFHRQAVDQSLPIRAGNISREIQEGLWKWTIYIQGSKQTLDQVRCVEYTLHPTFPNPVMEVCKRGTDNQAFPLTATGWGTFEVRMRVFLKSGGIQELHHQLKF
jgi:transcription initiation factor IIF auxiliary subunit